MRKKIKVNLFSVRSLESLKDSLQEYRDSLDRRCEAFVNDLLKIGIDTAVMKASETDGDPYGTHQMARYITFTAKAAELTEYGVRGIMIARGETLHSEWFRTVGEGEAESVQGEINALLVVEFGTAIFNLNGSGARHASESDWYFATSVDKNGKPTNWKHATAIQPTRPLHNAFLEMEQAIEEAAKRNF